jgi:uncharacterized protein with LGFP repeats
MIAIEFPEVNIGIAEFQEEYETLPAYHNLTEGSVTFAFKLNKEEMDEIVKTGIIYFKQLTGNNSMQPISMSTIKSDLING